MLRLSKDGVINIVGTLLILQHFARAQNIETTTIPSATTTTTTAANIFQTKDEISNETLALIANEQYCVSTLCEVYNGTHVLKMPHIGCQNGGTFGATCGVQPHLLWMNERRRNLILGMHNLARSSIALGQVSGYRTAAHMPLLRWDKELEYLASLHVKRCKFAHDLCRNTERFPYSGQNIGLFWIGREFKSHSKRMKSFILNWFNEYKDANMTFIEQYHPHPEGKKIGHFTMMVADRAHRIGCAAIRFRDPSQPNDMRFLMTCNYDFTNVLGESIYQAGPTASKCVYKISEQFPALCDWKDPIYDYDSEESVEDGNLLDNHIPF